MLGLIAFALLILACSYWKLSGQGNNDEADGAATEKGKSNSEDKTLHVFEEKYLVIMAGEVNPTFLATPMSSRASSFNDDRELDCKETEKTKNPMNEATRKSKLQGNRTLPLTHSSLSLYCCSAWWLTSCASENAAGNIKYCSNHDEGKNHDMSSEFSDLSWVGNITG